MLTEKCPFCGSYNNVDAAECYFCHKDLPDKPGHKKKRRTKPQAQQSIRLPPSLVTEKKKSPPGCLVSFVGFVFLACAVVIFHWVNTSLELVHWQIPLPATQAGAYISFYLEGLVGYINVLLQYPIVVVTSVLMLFILCWGLMNLRPWARALALMLLIILLVANLALFVTFVMHFYTTTENVINFCLILLGIGLNIYCLVWFFEAKKRFE
jgi:hypothetical protein